ncbi:MAG: DNA gyrase inhibitor YacG [Alphaproteobacteria bacterium]
MANDDSAGPRRGGRCPTCEAPTRHRFRPFCSKRCQDVDLGRWLRGSYRVPTEEGADDSTAEGDDDDSPFGPFGGNA